MKNNDDTNTINSNPVFVHNYVANASSRIRDNKAESNQDDKSPQVLSSSPHPHTKNDATTREILASDPPVDRDSTKKPKFNNRVQCRHWNFTFNNYTQVDYDQIKTALITDETTSCRKVVTCIVGKEIGETGTPHLQGYIHFKNVQRQQAVFKFFGYNHPCFHLQEQDLKRKPPIASFQYCMKGNDYYVVGKNPVEIERLKKKSKGEIGCDTNEYTELTSKIEKGEITTMSQVRNYSAEVAAKHEEYWKSLIVQYMPRVPVVKHPLRPRSISRCEEGGSCSSWSCIRIVPKSD
jgi:hypothetical protein